MIPADSPLAPKYWMDETSGVLAGVVHRYLDGQRLGMADVALMRVYLKQWINSPAWDQNPHADEDSRADLKQLRDRAAAIRCQRDIVLWLRDAMELGIDPL